MRRGRRGRPHLLCPPCPPIGRGAGQGAETSLGAERGCSRRGTEARAPRGRCAGPRSSSGCQPRARRCHGRPAPALRAPSGTEELGHRSARGSRSQDRCRQAVLGRGSRHSAKPVSSVRLRGVSTVQCNRLCVPRLCINQSYREPKQRRRHCVAHLLGGVRPVRAGRVLQRSTPVLVPFLLRGQVRLPVVLHDSRAVERGSHAVSSRHSSTVSKAPRGRGQHREGLQRASPGRGGRNHSGRQSKCGSAPEGQVKASPSLHKEPPPAGEPGGTSRPKSPLDSPTDSPAETSTSPSSPSKPVPASSSQTISAQPQVRPPAGTSRVPSKSRVQLRPRATSRQSSETAGQQRPQSSATALGQPQPAQESSGSAQRPNTSSSQGSQSPSGTAVPAQSPNKTSDGPGDPAPKASKSGRQNGKESLTQPSGSSSVPELPGSSPSESSLEYTSESTTEVTCRWPHPRHRLRCLQHCWRLKHLAC
ncbi:unnamed protein product [Nyctereutes procyonoides]|uniref:(raccoon dog) hypothetical protein n=1 Tax=Nyctereutes procyonoides TaxID=34880 RepID=A0A811ZAY2_NYCPR|nr:unnamed protein product [Nyctereutes procyonoides]